MPITIRDAKHGAAPRKRNIASLVGGIVIAAGCFALWMLVSGELMGRTPGPAVIGAGLLAAGAVGVWIRVADL